MSLPSQITKPMPRRAQTETEQLALAREIFDAVFNSTDSFREANVGADLAYLIGAIVDPREDMSSVDWTPEGYGASECVLRDILKDAFSHEHRVWAYIEL